MERGAQRVIPLGDPAALPLAVRAVREAAGNNRLRLAVDVAVREHRQFKGIAQQWHTWEIGRKSPILTSLGPYLGAHGLRLGLLGIDDDVHTPWCPARSNTAARHRCAVAAGHAGRHRDYAGNDF